MLGRSIPEIKIPWTASRVLHGAAAEFIDNGIVK